MKTKIVGHKILCEDPEILLETIPKGLKWKIVKKNLVVWVPKWPHSDAFKFIDWCARQGIDLDLRLANGYL